jgi:carbonic anhydrase
MKLIAQPIAIVAALAISSAALAGSQGGAGTAAEQGLHTPTMAAAESAHGQAAPAESGHAAWGYAGRNGPEFWGRLSPDYAACGTGATQSPIDIDASHGQSGGLSHIDYRLTPLSILHNGHTVQVNYAPGSGVTVDGERYELLQFHFHVPSEHWVNGKPAAMEAHMVHKNAQGGLAVVGVLIESGAANLALQEMWPHMPRNQAPERTVPNVLVNARDLLPVDGGYHRYMGSLTTPPCSEGVKWFVMHEPVQASVEQIERLVAAVGQNARPVQALNNRLLLAPAN